MKITFKRQLLPLYIITGSLLLIFIIYLSYEYALNYILLITIGWMLIITFLLWIGNRAITMFLNKKLPWADYLTLRFFVQLLASLTYALICVNASYLIFKFSFTHDPPSQGQIFMVNVYGVLLILPVFSMYYVIYFIKEWKKSKIESEQFQKESIKSQLTSLKNHLDPHFLFNNLNILSTLIEKGGKDPKEYLNRFAEVYRYMLQNNSMELIPLRKELEFIDSYLQLIKMRFQNSLRFSIDIPPKKMDHTIPPLTIQMLVENSIKHNTLNDEKPLEIKINYLENDYLCIRNNITAKKTMFQSDGSGLKNIKDRYKFFTDNAIIIENDGTFFTVKIPILEIEEI